ncbi:nucleoside-diphosphate sugar epimerase [Rhodoferax saidenbachensis]|uniref:Nucleoside-diphosphate sugar epimerase n=1 Tax=Rhodoferax saidenbachensis TaxID=1484693 RepID=A0A1P8K7Y0_9BURK|nr:nucleoside-diphosphate sugar epimerase [Rhodoferax saidenbachensis]
MAATAADTAAAVAMVVGATGLVGREVLADLLADKRYTKVHSVGRRQLAGSIATHRKLAQHVVDFKDLSTLAALPAVDEVFIALGTTIKVAGSQEAFRAVDYEAVVAAARAARAQGATKLGVVSAMGADPRSSIFYNRVKGEMEVALAGLGFQSVVIARPSMLAGDREALNQPTRAGEGIALVISRVFKPLIPKDYRSITARDVAAGLVQGVQSTLSGVIHLLSGALQGAADRG